MKLQLLWLVPRLGVVNVLRVLWYRAMRWSGAIRLRTPAGSSYSGPFVRTDIERAPSPFNAAANERLLARAQGLIFGTLGYFGHVSFDVGAPPDWFADPFEKTRLDATAHWSAYREFSSFPGDVKTVWEPSRYAWAMDLARAYASTGDTAYLDHLNDWVEDWVAKNPANVGPNWLCGQETSIRLIHFLYALKLAEPNGDTTPAAARFVNEHCRRIGATLSYAIAQDNNHGTSEAAALFLGGVWLGARAGAFSPRIARSWRTTGRRILEERVTRLVSPDGSFSQYSTNYQRVLVDTLSLVEIWRRAYREPPFSQLFYSRARAATAWLYGFVDRHSGDAPNIGANDGANLLAVTETTYRDFRPSVQLASMLFEDRAVYPPGDWDEAPFRFGVDAPRELGSRCSAVHAHGGFAVLSSSTGDSWGALRFPAYRFRPSHADALHFDLWVNGENLIRDAGTYSYSASESQLRYFSGTASHSTCQFDDRDQMPRLGRFLFGKWLAPAEIGELIERDHRIELSAAYVDAWGAGHRRTVIANGTRWEVVDELEGYSKRAVLRWRLMPGAWVLDGTRVTCSTASVGLHVAQGSLRRCELVEGWESRHYLQCSDVPVLELELAPDRAQVRTTISLGG